jgi:hypothetical protein
MAQIMEVQVFDGKHLAGTGEGWLDRVGSGSEFISSKKLYTVCATRLLVKTLLYVSEQKGVFGVEPTFVRK